MGRLFFVLALLASGIPLFAVLLLPLAALAFRRGWLLGVVLCTGLLAQPKHAMAFSWDDLWQRGDQQAARALRLV